MKKFILFLAGPFLFSQQNVVISTSSAPNEPSITINENNTNQIAAGANLNNYYYSTDAGLTWTAKKLSSSYGVWGDPSLLYDGLGNLFFAHLSNPSSGNWIDRIVVQKSTDSGITYNNGSFVGLNGSKNQDKQWISKDKNNNLYMAWTQFDEYGSSDPAKKSSILFSKSTNNGTSWSPALKINQIDGDCIDESNTVEGAVPALGPNNEIYISWASSQGIIFDKSTDGGTTWLANDKIIATIPGGWSFAVPGLDRANGLPITACDISSSPYKGTIYVNWSDQRNGTNDTDIWLIKSTDGGENWSSPIRVNNDAAGKQQFLTWMAIDQTNGNLYFVFYDRRNYSDNKTDVYMAKSTDGGQTFINKKISQNAFTPNDQIFFGDYTNIAVHNGVIRPIWGDQVSGVSRVLTAIVKDSDLLAVDQVSDNKNEVKMDLYPNPVHDEAYLSYKLHEDSKVKIEIYDVSGKLIKTVLDKNQAYGKYVEKIEIAKLSLTKGNYILQLKINDTIKKSVKFIK